ncbi:cyanophycinase [Hymenobacter sp. BT175]|uniref:cyanophycinase n=1 Tax=Hymenobacter translucens TaxID=2886507 RepID=UPI001D0F34AC|nr:cyanophycinase [Hymenobacter translucens]MCC2547304.1 cyanophycinase [Hymenobacter translucens]
MAKHKKDPSTHHRDTCPIPKGKLIAVGGHENKGDEAEKGSNQDQNRNFTPDAILQRFCDELKGENPLVVILPIASSVPEESTQDYLDAFERLGIKRLKVLDVRERADASKPEVMEMVEEGAGFWFTGGDQLRLTALLGGTTMLERLKERYTYDPIVIAGTSAGATAMSTPMVYEGRDNAGFRKGEIAITTGLEFMMNVAIDTHFIARGRIIRMTQVIATNPACVGLGLEEDTAVVIHEGRELEVIGSGQVTILEGHNCTSTDIHEIRPQTPFSIRGLTLHLLAAGQRYELTTQPPLHR